jgi:hypothetical protein
MIVKKGNLHDATGAGKSSTPAVLGESVHGACDRVSGGQLFERISPAVARLVTGYQALPVGFLFSPRMAVPTTADLQFDTMICIF